MEARRREVKRLPHHEQESLCTTRPPYRQGRQLTAVKVYTVNDESQHLIISGVPALGLQDDLRRLCARYGDVKSLTYVPNYSSEKFVEGYHVQFARIQSSRFAKKQIDGRAFFGESLQVCYAPEMESVLETRNKLMQRRRDVARRCVLAGTNSDSSASRSRKFNEDESFSERTETVKPFSTEMCIWNGKETSHDPRLLVPAKELEKVSSAHYGPQPLCPDWRDVGVREVVVKSVNTKRCFSTPTKVAKFLKPAANMSLHKAMSIVCPKPLIDSKSNISLSINDSSPGKVVPPILRFVPSQIKGAQRKIIFHPKQKASAQVPSENKSLDETIQSVRDKITAVSMPNVKVLLDRQDKVFSTSNK